MGVGNSLLVLCLALEILSSFSNDRMRVWDSSNFAFIDVTCFISSLSIASLGDMGGDLSIVSVVNNVISLAR